ncbi:hypothetical protein [Nitrosomonas eutropha]|uniref:hypothetical protein n=1 Tax=Nitrosomonas eutropha TaxID=916 RepID=UPI00210C5036|nr:hypothetical protein [Nitrosomonas eutropha]
MARHSLGTITTTFDTTKQNVFRAVATLMEDAQTAQETIAKIRPVFNKLNVPKKQYNTAHEFFFTSKSLDEIAQQTNSTVEGVLKIARCTIKHYQLYTNKDAIKERKVEFDKILRYSRAGEKSIQICYDHFVIQDTLTVIAEKYEITKQNTYNIIKRFEEALARYEAENPPKPKRRKIIKP